MKEGIMEDGLCLKVYNPFIQKVIAVYDNYNKAANRLGLTVKCVVYYSKEKKRVMAPLLNQIVALRVSRLTEKEINQIIITNKRGHL